ncbi:unnamed protein product [Penicillium salamii]|uniref:Glutamate--cysteine ligase n=1 Tax=Penicillium salamii TaxID=1612424 RepID=A0A9W4JZ71_9EURO|nr:unnamed protein product [Penicillium salamii]CAG8200947.1 unnamed protein product [Penicillium salamii]CAG8271338.1 unnamed protein product [Penicillium salamii]CAG8302808.1 unnamed protein product [Penicillium salamii]CAG8361248.1 unnamed protein product [Penicillium salamii]
MIFMVEGVAEPPYGQDFKAMLSAENDMRERRSAVQDCLGLDELPLTIPMFPRLGAGNFTSTETISSKRLYSHVMSEDLFSHFERSKVMSDNLRGRRGTIAGANIPIFRDVNTPWPWKDESVNWTHSKEETPLPFPTPAPNCVYVDHFSWSGGACGLQATFQAKNMEEARSLHDQLCPLSALMLALTAGSPCYKGYLVDTDSRWHVTNALNDDRSMSEILSHGLDENATAAQMRWSFSPLYAGHGHCSVEDYQSYSSGNPDDQAVLEKSGMDPDLARFFTHMLKYDHLVVDPKHLEPESASDTYHFRALIGSLWPDIRFKPPPDGSDIGWRVEFRPMEVQMTDFENAAFVVFMALMRRAISYFDLNFYIPMSLVAENMRRAVMRDAVNQNKFWFREVVRPEEASAGSPSSGNDTDDSNASAGYREMSLKEIMCGSDPDAWGSSLEGGAPFPGLIYLVHSMLDAVNVDSETRAVLDGYLEFVAKRASGDLWTTAKWMRHFVQTHENYKADSVVSEDICYDLMCAIEDVTLGRACGPTV